MFRTKEQNPWVKVATLTLTPTSDTRPFVVHIPRSQCILQSNHLPRDIILEEVAQGLKKYHAYTENCYRLIQQTLIDLTGT